MPSFAFQKARPNRAARCRRLLEAATRDRKPERFWTDLREGLEKKEIKPEEFSIRELFEQFVPDGREIVDSWNPRHGGGGENLALLENAGAVNTADFSNISGQIVYSKILDQYNMAATVFTSLVGTTPTQFNGEKIAGLNRIGDEAADIGEGQSYPLVGFGEDWIETPETTKKGMILGLTKEAVFFDRTGQIVNRASEIGTWLGIEKEKRIIDAFIDENRMVHRYNWKGTTYATYQTSTPWVNVSTSNTLADWTDIEAMELILAGLTDPYTGEPIELFPTHLIVTPQLRYTAMRILNATEIRSGDITSGAGTQIITGNPLATRYQLVTSQLLKSRLNTDTNWFLGDPSRAFTYMENWPLTVVEAPANSEAEFSQDIVRRWKASERGEIATLEPRAMGKATQ